MDVELDRRDGSIDFRFLDRTQGNQELAFYDTTFQLTALGEAIADRLNCLQRLRTMEQKLEPKKQHPKVGAILLG